MDPRGFLRFLRDVFSYVSKSEEATAPWGAPREESAGVRKRVTNTRGLREVCFTARLQSSVKGPYNPPTLLRAVMAGFRRGILL